jgi:hypothetical protein
VVHEPALVADWLYETVIRHVGMKAVHVYRPSFSAAKLSVLWLLLEEGSVPAHVMPDLAASPSVPLWLAQRITGTGDSFAQSRLAMNPRAPASILVELAGGDVSVRDQVARNEGAPAEALIRLAGHRARYTRRIVARNPASPVEAIERLVGDREADIRGVAERHPRAPSPERRREILLESEHGRRLLRAEDPATGHDDLLALCADPDDGVREAVAANPAFRPGADGLVDLSASAESEGRMFAGEHGETPPSILERLARDEAATVRRAVAGNVAAPPHVLALLVDDPAPLVHLRLADNPATPPDLLERLVDAGDRFTCQHVARNPSTPPELLRRLFRDRLAVAEVAASPRAPVDVLLAIADLTEGPCLSPWRALAERDDLPWAVAERLLRHPTTAVHHPLLARASPLPAGALEAMAQSTFDGQRLFAARHPGTPLPLLERLAEDAEPFVRWTVTENAAAPPALIARIELAFLTSVAAEGGMLGRLVALSCPKAAPSEDLVRAAQSSACWLERYALARSPFVPAPVLARLADDPDGWVRRAVVRGG